MQASQQNLDTEIARSRRSSRAYTPPPASKHFDEMGRMSFLDRLEDKPMAAPDDDAMTSVDDSQDLLPRLHWAPASYPQLLVPRPSSLLALGSTWVRSMASVASNDPASRESSVSAWPARDRRGRDLLGRRRSASPVRSSSRSTISLPLQRARFVGELQRVGQEFDVIDPLWTSRKPLSWNKDYLGVGYLLIRDECAQARLRYWAACSPDGSTLPALLYKAV